MCIVVALWHYNSQRLSIFQYENFRPFSALVYIPSHLLFSVKKKLPSPETYYWLPIWTCNKYLRILNGHEERGDFQWSHPVSRWSLCDHARYICLITNICLYPWCYSFTNEIWRCPKRRVRIIKPSFPGVVLFVYSGCCDIAIWYTTIFHAQWIIVTN